jgi:CheY-specific phosphatase CheX
MRPLDSVARAKPWRSVQQTLRSAAASFLSCEATLDSEVPSDAPQGFGCVILLSNVAQELEIRIGIAIDAAGALVLALNLFGEEGNDLAQDLLSELANIFMGALKSDLSAHSIAFIGGLPAATGPESVTRPPNVYQYQEAFRLIVQNRSLTVHVGLRSKANVRLTRAGLREGMVIAKDLCNAGGLLLIKGGTRLSETMIERLESQVGERETIEVNAP